MPMVLLRFFLLDYILHIDQKFQEQQLSMYRALQRDSTVTQHISISPRDVKCRI